jgi:hypothetical protein
VLPIVNNSVVQMLNDVATRQFYMACYAVPFSNQVSSFAHLVCWFLRVRQRHAHRMGDCCRLLYSRRHAHRMGDCGRLLYSQRHAHRMGDCCRLLYSQRHAHRMGDCGRLLYSRPDCWTSSNLINSTESTHKLKTNKQTVPRVQCVCLHQLVETYLYTKWITVYSELCTLSNAAVIFITTPTPPCFHIYPKPWISLPSETYRAFRNVLRDYKYSW